MDKIKNFGAIWIYLNNELDNEVCAELDEFLVEVDEIFFALESRILEELREVRLNFNINEL